MTNSFVQAAKKVLQTEADALETLKNDLPNDFSDLVKLILNLNGCLLYTSPSPRDRTRSRMPSSA